MMEIRYIDRDKDGNITGTFAIEQYKGQETLPEDAPEIQAFTDSTADDALNEEKIQNEIFKLTRATAIQNLKDRAELPVDYMDTKI
jgi:hypothetical protein